MTFKEIYQKRNKTASPSKENKGLKAWFKLNMKYISLTILVIQNSMLVLMMRCSRTTTKPDQMYITSTAVFMSEVVKLTSCFLMLYSETGDFKSWKRISLNIIFKRPRELALMFIPSGLYAVQNNLLYIALGNLEAATFQVTYQLKTLSTAIFSVWLLGKILHRTQWISLFLLMTGVALVQLENMNTTLGTNDQKPMIGLMAVLVSCISSGFAGCYFEKLLKTSSTPMWVRNTQLAIGSVFFSGCAMLISDHHKIVSSGFFKGYDQLTWYVITNQAMGGLLVALVVKYADNILKGFATSISIILSGIISFYLLDFEPSTLFVIGTTIVITATVLYGSK